MADIQKNNPNNYLIFNKLKLVNSIIDFCKKNYNQYINYDNNDQIMELINRLSPNPSDLKYDNTILDPLHYIDAEKKTIKFITSEFNLFKVKIPITITKLDLYSIAMYYRERFYSSILLVYKDTILEEDETSINFISDDDTFIIIEDRIYPNDTYYNSLIAQNKNEEMISFRIRISDLDETLFLPFPSNIPVSEMKKAIELKLGYHNISFSGKLGLSNKDKIIKNIFKIDYRLDIFLPLGGPLTILDEFGKKVLVNVTDINKEVITEFEIGLLNSNKYLIKRIESYMNKKFKVKKLYFEEKEISLDKEKSLTSLGIKDNFICKIERIPNRDN